MRVLHLITGMDTGGAEQMLLKLVSHRSADGPVSHAVVSLRSGGALSAGFRENAAPVEQLGLNTMPGMVLSLPRLAAAVRSARPDVIQGWMYHGNLAASAAKTIHAKRTPCLWNVRQTFSSFANEKRMTGVAIRLGARLSRSVNRILYNSDVSRLAHEAIGFAPARARVIPNGFDLSRFRPSGPGTLRARLGLRPHDPLIGHVGRFHPMKDHENLLQAAALAVEADPRIRVALIGKGLDRSNPTIVRWIEDRGLTGSVSVLGECRDVPELLPDLDVFTLASSHGEGFPNAIGEAMACGVICVATDVGDCRHVIGSTGFVVPPRDPASLAAGWLSVLRAPPEERRRCSAAARERVATLFSIESVARRYREVWTESLERGGL